MPEWTKEAFQLFVLEREALAVVGGDFEEPARRQAYLAELALRGYAVDDALLGTALLLLSLPARWALLMLL